MHCLEHLTHTLVQGLRLRQEVTSSVQVTAVLMSMKTNLNVLRAQYDCIHSKFKIGDAMNHHHNLFLTTYVLRVLQHNSERLVN
jgi:hypothetical protein